MLLSICRGVEELIMVDGFSNSRSKPGRRIVFGQVHGKCRTATVHDRGAAEFGEIVIGNIRISEIKANK